MNAIARVYDFVLKWYFLSVEGQETNLELAFKFRWMIACINVPISTC